MDTGTQKSATTNDTAISNEEKTELQLHDDIVVEGASTADENVEQSEGSATEKDTTETSKERNSEERKAHANEKNRAARKERVKNATNIRFTLGESGHEINKVKKVVQKAPSSTNLIIELSDSSSSNAISTPTQLLRDMISTTELQEIVINEIPEENEIERLLFDDSDDDDEDIVQETVMGVDSVKAKTDFLDNFDIPSLNDISEGDSVEYFEHLQAKLSQLIAVTMDPGKFVDPLTGGSLASSSSTQSSESSKELNPDVNISSMSEDMMSEDMMSEDMFDFDNLMSFKIDFKDEDEHIFPKFETNLSLTGCDITYENWEKRPSARAVRGSRLITNEFLNDIIKNVVAAVENRKLEDILNIKCDKLKLHKKLQEQFTQYKYEKYTSDYLNTKVLEYFKRMRNHQAFATLPTELHEREYERYMDSLKRLDFNLIAVAEAKKKNSYLMSSVQMDLSSAQSISYYSELHLSKKVLATLGHKSDNIRRITERELRLMSNKRNEISDTRLRLIIGKHTLARIGEKIYKLQQIKDDISLDDYLAMQNLNGQLEKKIEERNADLKRIRDHYHSALHINQHCQEKRQAILAMLKLRQYKLQKAMKTQQQLRERLSKAKVERRRIRNLHSDLSYQGGLLGVPSLMHDYDATVEKVKAKRAVVNDLRLTVSRLTQRISDLEASCRKST